MPTTVFINVTDAPYNADATGASDASADIQDAIDDAHANGGGVVQVPAGKYKLESGLTLKEHVQLVGVGTGVYPTFSPVDDERGGTWFLVYSTAIIPVTMLTHARIEGVGFWHDQNPPSTTPDTPYSPKAFPQTIQVDRDDCVIRDVFLLNCTAGIVVGQPSTPALPKDVPMVNAGRVLIDRVFGQPMDRGIMVYCSLDVARFVNVHFWPYWAQDEPAQTANLMDYTREHGIAFLSYRNDNPHFVNCFAFAYYAGFMFHKLRDQTIGFEENGDPIVRHVVSSNFHIVNCETDHCRTGIELVSDDDPAFSVNAATPVNHTGQVSNFTMQGGGMINGELKGIDGSCGIRTTGLTVESVFKQPKYNRVFGSNVRVSMLAWNGVRADGSENQLQFDGLWVDSWNLEGQELPIVPPAVVPPDNSHAAIEVATGSTVVVGPTNDFTNGRTGPLTGGSGTAFIHCPVPAVGESVLSSAVTLSSTSGNWTTVPVGFTAPTSGVYLVTLSARGGANASSANSSITARLTKNASAVTSTEVQVVWAQSASALAGATACRTYRLQLAAGDVIGVEAAGFFTGLINSFIASDTFGRTSLTWEQVEKR